MTKNRDNGYKHKINRMEKEYNVIQEKLSKVLTEKNNKENAIVMKANIEVRGSNKSSQIISNTNPSKWSANAQNHSNQHLTAINEKLEAEIEMLQQTNSNYEERLKEVINENCSIRDAFKILEKELHTAIQTYKLNENNKTNTDSQTNSNGETNQINPSSFDLPWQFMKDNINITLKEKISFLKQRLESLKSSELQLTEANGEQTKSNNQELDKLRQLCEEQKQILLAQDSLLTSALFNPDNSSLAQLQLDAEAVIESRRLSLYEEIEEEKRILRSQTNNIIKLQQELQVERQKFNEEKFLFNQQKYKFQHKYSNSCIAFSPNINNNNNNNNSQNIIAQSTPSNTNNPNSTSEKKRTTRAKWNLSAQQKSYITPQKRAEMQLNGKQLIHNPLHSTSNSISNPNGEQLDPETLSISCSTPSVFSTDAELSLTLSPFSSMEEEQEIPSAVDPTQPFTTILSPFNSSSPIVNQKRIPTNSNDSNSLFHITIESSNVNSNSDSICPTNSSSHNSSNNCPTITVSSFPPLSPIDKDNQQNS